MVLTSEQLQALLTSARGVALCDLIKQSLIAPTIFHYEDILLHANVKELATRGDEEINKLVNTLKLFTYGKMGLNSIFAHFFNLKFPHFFKVQCCALFQSLNFAHFFNLNFAHFFNLNLTHFFLI